MEKLKVETIRHELGYSQEEMAKILGITPQSYRNKISGKSEWKGSELIKISKLSKLPLDQIRFL